MHINITFLLQIINLLVCYAVLNKFLFHPVLASLNGKKKEEFDLKEAIVGKGNLLLQLKKDQNSAVVVFQEHTSKQYPFVRPPHTVKELEEDIEIKKITIDTKKLKQEFSEWLVTKVPHGY